ncbi:MAG TPA: type II toxin-antitoxin system PemK/MazF family toxin [Candidatus Saccharimonadales bacterium]|nr:type II toxin-antitoxin system PemK/MazF family toxin [Candidatus Saccharimonadales bacterium]
MVHKQQSLISASFTGNDPIKVAQGYNGDKISLVGIRKLLIMHQKDFDSWNKKKIKLDAKPNDGVFFYEKEVWWVSIGHNIRFEQDGKGSEFARPVLVLRKFNKFLFLGVPLSSTKKLGKYYFSFVYKGRQESAALLSQLRAYDSNRLIDKDGVIDDRNYQMIQKKIAKIINQKPVK